MKGKLERVKIMIIMIGDYMNCDECGMKMRDVGCCGENWDEEHDCYLPINLYQCPSCNRVDVL